MIPPLEISELMPYAANIVGVAKVDGFYILHCVESAWKRHRLFPLKDWHLETMLEHAGIANVSDAVGREVLLYRRRTLCPREESNGGMFSSYTDYDGSDQFARPEDAEGKRKEKAKKLAWRNSLRVEGVKFRYQYRSLDCTYEKT